MIRDQHGDSNPGWVGDDAAYQTLHTRVKVERGLATKHNCIDCGKPAKEWSQKEETSGLNLYDHYDPRCISCHHKYDKLNQGEKCATAKLTEEDVLEIRSKYSIGGYTQQDLAYIYGVTQSAIYKIVNYINWRHI